MASAAQTQLLYITYFGRPADPAGLSFWTTGPQSGLPLDQVADFFAADTEFAQTTAGKTTSQIVNSFYRNAFGRDADAPGLQYWTNKVTNGEISIQDVGLFISLGALALPVGSPDRVALESKQAASQRWTDLVAGDTTASLEFAGPLAATYGVDFLVPVKTPGTIPSQQATLNAIAQLPDVGTVGLLASNVSSVNEGGTVTFTITTIPDLAGQSLSYQLSGVQAADVVGGQISGTVLVSNTGVATISVTIANDNLVELGESLTITFPDNLVAAKPLGGNTVTINDTTVPNLQVQPSAGAVSEGGVLTFSITSTNLPPGTSVTYNLTGTGLTSADVNNAALSGSVVLDANRQAQVTFNISNDLTTEGAEAVTFTATGGGAPAASVISVINDTSVQPIPELSASAQPSAVDEGSTLTFLINASGIAPGTVLTYNVTGISSADVNGALLSGTRVVKSDGTVDAVVLQVSADLQTEGQETATITVQGGGAVQATASAVISDTSIAPIPTLSASAQPSAVNEGSTLTFLINASGIAPGTVLSYAVTGISPADVNGALLTGTRTVNSDGTVDAVIFQVSADLTTEGQETASFTVSGGGAAQASTSAVINDTSTTPPPPTSFLLTTNQDIVAGSAVPLFRFIGNEQTLGQGDRLSIGDADEAVLEVDVAGQFNLNNFSTEGIDTLVLNGDGVQAVGDSSVSLSNTDIRDIIIERAIQNKVLFDDLQINNLFAIISDSIGDYEFNFDASQLNTGRQRAVVWLDEIPVDAGLEGVGLYFSQALNNAEAKLEELVLGSFNVSGDDSTNFVNLVRKISVGVALDTLIIFGDTSLTIEKDLGLPGSYANPFITLIDAEDLDADLTLTYTTQVQDAVTPNTVPDVVVIGAQGVNDLTFASTGARPADFGVTTFDGDDLISTTTGDDRIAAGEGNNEVDAGEGNNSVFAGNGDNLVATGDGNDFISLGDGDNAVDAGNGDNEVFVGDGDNEVLTGTGNDGIFAGIGSNVIRAGDGNNTVQAGVLPDGTPLNAGNNKVITGSGIDFVETGNGADIIVVGDDLDFSRDVVNSNGGTDLVITGNGDDVVNAGSGNDDVAVGQGTVTVDLGLGNDDLWITANNLEGDDFINGGASEAAGVRDRIIFTAGGTVLRSETEGVTNVEEFVLRNLEAAPQTVSSHADVQEAFEETIGGVQADYDLALSNALVDGSNDLSGGVRRFTVNAVDALADVTLDLTPVASRDSTPQRNLVGITYLGSSDGYTERLIVSDQQLNARLIADFDDSFEAAGDILEIIDTTDASLADLRGISGLDVIELNASVNTAQTFTITLDQAFIVANASAADPIIIRATNGLPAGSRLDLNVSAVTSAGINRSIVVEKSGNLIVNIIGDPLLGQPGAKVQVVDAFFLTSNTDDINGTVGDDLIIVDSADDLNPSDNVNGGDGFDTLLFEFGVADGQVDFPSVDLEVVLPGVQAQTLQNGGENPYAGLTGYVALLGSYPFEPFGHSYSAGNNISAQASIPGFTFEGLPIITELVTQVTNLLNTPVDVDATTFEGIFNLATGQFVSPSQPDLQDGGVAIAALPFASFPDVDGQTLESQLNFIDVEEVEKFVFNPTNDNGVRFVGFNSLETFETPGFFDGTPADAQLGQLDLLSLEILQTFDSNRSPNAGAGFALIEGNGAPLNDILFLDDFSWNIDVTTKAEAFWDDFATDTFDVEVINFRPGNNANGPFLAGFQGNYNFSRYNAIPASLNNFEYGSFFDGTDVGSEAAQQRRSAGSTSLDFALEVNTGAGNDYVWRGVFGESATGDDIGEIIDGHYLAGYLVDTGSGDDVVTLDDVAFGYGEEGVEQFGLFGGFNFQVQGGNVFYPDGNPFYAANGAIKVGDAANEDFAFADDVVLTRSGNDFVVDYGGDNIIYSGIGNDFVFTGQGNDFIISDDDDELDATSAESEIGGEAIVGPASTVATDNDIVLADGPLIGSFLQFSLQYNPPGSQFFFLGQISPGVFGQDYVRDLTGDNIISTGGNDDTVVAGLGDDIILAGTLGDLDGAGEALYDDSDVINDLGGHNLIVTLGDDDYIESGNGSDVILAGFGADNDVVFAGGGADFIEIAAGSDYVDAGAGNDFIVSLLGASSPVLSLQDGDWNGISTGDTILGGTGFDSLLLAFGGSQDDIVIAPRLVNTFSANGVPNTVSAVPNIGAYPASYADAANGDGSVNPILDSVETLILFSDDADIYLTNTVADQAKNLVEVAPGVFANQVSVFLNDLDYNGLGSGVDIVLDASAFEADSSLRAFAFNIGASDLQSGITGSAGLIGGSGIDFLAAGSFLESEILAGGTDVASLINEIRSFLDNQALDNFVGADVSTILSGILNTFGNQAASIIQTFLNPNYPSPGLDAVAQIQAALDLVSENLTGDFVEDFITYQGNGGGDFITLEPTVLDPNGDPVVPENTVEFVRYETTRDGANAGVAAGFDQVFNFNNSDTDLPYTSFNTNVVPPAPVLPANPGALTNFYAFNGALPTTNSEVVVTNAFGDITGDKIVFGGGVGQVGDVISKNGNQLVDLFKVNASVDWSKGRGTSVFNGGAPGDPDINGVQYQSGDEALFVDAAIQITNGQITTFSTILAQINTFGTSVDSLNQGGLIVVNGGDKALYAVYQETDGNFVNIAQSELSILGVVQGIDTNSFRLQASDFIIDNSFITYGTAGPFNANVPFTNPGQLDASPVATPI